MRVALVIAVLSVPSVASAQATTWTIDPGHSAAQFSVRHMVVSNVRGEFDGPSGTVTFDPKDIAGTLKVDASIDAKTINTRNPDRDKDLRSSLFFDVDKFPRITFKSKRAEAAGAGRFRLVGDLTIHGVTKEVTLDVQGPTPEIKDIWGGVRVGATATTSVDRREFGLLYNRMLEAGGAVVGNEVNITIDLEVTRQAVKE
ncbi:MAG TPA: YceI family protein [Vicinamibacterales bacterium]|jgi:polyisoprenoid-binding protein YceI